MPVAWRDPRHHRRMRSEKSHQDAGGRGFDSRHLHPIIMTKVLVGAIFWGAPIRVRTRSGHTRTRKHRRLGANGGPGWSLGVSNRRHITNHSTARLCHGRCPAPCGRSPSGLHQARRSAGTGKWVQRTAAAEPSSGADGSLALGVVRYADLRSARPVSEAVVAAPPRRSVRE